MSIKIAINGFGRIGRAAFKAALEQSDLEVVAINNPGDLKMLAHLLKYDTVYGKFDKKVEVEGEDYLIIDRKKYRRFSEKEPNKLPWKDLNIDVVLECTGKFRKKADAALHLQAGAKRVIISAPAKGEDPVGTYVLGVNQEEMNHESDAIISNASCTTNCIAPVMKVLEEKIGIAKALMTTIHAYTADQNLIDGTHKKDFRRARAAALNIIPTETGAARAAGKVIPSLAGKFDGLAMRVPVACGSLSDVVFLAKRATSVEEINAILKEAAQATHQDIIEVSEEPLVSSDVIGNSASCVVDLSLTNVIDGDLVKIVAWYDNEWGYSVRLVEQAIEVGKRIK